MFKRMSTEMLKEENYLEALAYLCGLLLKKKTIDSVENELDRIDDVLWALANSDKADRLDDATGQEIIIITALRIAVDDYIQTLDH